jgi:hypothetical protein
LVPAQSYSGRVFCMFLTIVQNILALRPWGRTKVAL